MTEGTFTPVSDCAVLVTFGKEISEQTSDRVFSFDKAIGENPPFGFKQAVPAYVNILVIFDPLLTDHSTIIEALKPLTNTQFSNEQIADTHAIEVCYDDELSPDLDIVAEETGLSKEAVINAHLNGDYRVAMYGFAPGYAYMSGLAQAIRLPRKETPVRDVAKGSIIIAGSQCIITTMKMPAGWWRIGMSPTQIWIDEPARPFLFNVGDRVKFKRIDRKTYDALERKNGS